MCASACVRVWPGEVFGSVSDVRLWGGSPFNLYPFSTDYAVLVANKSVQSPLAAMCMNTGNIELTRLCTCVLPYHLRTKCTDFKITIFGKQDFSFFLSLILCLNYYLQSSKCGYPYSYYEITKLIFTIYTLFLTVFF